MSSVKSSALSISLLLLHTENVEKLEDEWTFLATGMACQESAKSFTDFLSFSIEIVVQPDFVSKYVKQRGIQWLLLLGLSFELIWSLKQTWNILLNLAQFQFYLIF